MMLQLAAYCRRGFSGIGIPQLALAALVLQNTFLILFMRYSRTVEGPLYASSTAVFSMECVKMLTCILVLAWYGESDLDLPIDQQTSINNPATSMIIGIQRLRRSFEREVWNKPREVLLLAVPSFLYTLQNNLLYYALSHLDAATFQVGYQTKILTTALFSVWMLNKTLASRQWLSLLLLTIGVSLAQLSAQSSQESKQNTTSGFLAVCMAAVTSGFSGVFFEMILKNAKTSLWMRNVQMCLSSIVVAFAGVFLSEDRYIVFEHGFFYGYSWVVITVILLQAVGGLVVAVVVKYADNILKGFAASFSIVSSCTLSYFFLDFNPSGLFVVGTSLVIMSMYMYGYSPPTKKQEDESLDSKGPPVLLMTPETKTKRFLVDREKNDGVMSV